MYWHRILSLVACLVSPALVSAQIPKLKETEAQKNARVARLPPCAACRSLVESFEKGMDRTKNMKSEGGDTAWEEATQFKYATSEVRFIEIQEHLCEEMVRGSDQCHELFTEHEEAFEEWWKDSERDSLNLHQHICIKQLKVCCPKGTFGQECAECPGGKASPCFSNGKCVGDGTRKGNGRCECSEGYEGSECMVCSVGFFEEYRDTNKLLCTKCHAACMGHCSGAGPQSCEACNPGWTHGVQGDPKSGCEDINECLSFEKAGPCDAKNAFCVNNPGSFACLDCDRSCSGCTGDGPDFCLQCADGFARDGKGSCIDQRPKYEDKRDTWTRYLTYLGLCVATFIIFQRNTLIASIVGIVVATYVSYAEWFFAQTFNQQETS